MKAKVLNCITYRLRINFRMVGGWVGSTVSGKCNVHY